MSRQGGIRKRAWPRSEIAALDVDSSAVPRLTLHLATRRRKSLLLYRTEDELLWIATLLREAHAKAKSSEIVRRLGEACQTGKMTRIAQARPLTEFRRRIALNW